MNIHEAAADVLAAAGRDAMAAEVRAGADPCRALRQAAAWPDEHQAALRKAYNLTVVALGLERVNMAEYRKLTANR